MGTASGSRVLQWADNGTADHRWRLRYGSGAAFRIRPGTIHRVKALEDTLILEVSTPQLEDVVRLEDKYGRTEH